MKIFFGLSVVMISALLVSCTGNGCYGPQNPYGWGPMMHYGFGYGGMFMWVLFLIIVGFLIYFVVQAQKSKNQAIQPESPLDILRRRYAKGEITGEEYEKMKKDLE
jgi:putative membrane protein